MKVDQARRAEIIVDDGTNTDTTPKGWHYDDDVIGSWENNVTPSAFTARCIGGQIRDQARRAGIVVDDGIDINAPLKGWHC